MTDYILIFIVIAIFCIFALVIFGISSMCKFNHPTPVDEDDKPKIEGSSACVAHSKCIVYLEFYIGIGKLKTGEFILICKVGVKSISKATIPLPEANDFSDPNIIINKINPILSKTDEYEIHNDLMFKTTLLYHSTIMLVSQFIPTNVPDPYNIYIETNNTYNALLEYYIHMYIAYNMYISEQYRTINEGVGFSSDINLLNCTFIELDPAYLETVADKYEVFYVKSPILDKLYDYAYLYINCVYDALKNASIKQNFIVNDNDNGPSFHIGEYNMYIKDIEAGRSRPSKLSEYLDVNTLKHSWHVTNEQGKFAISYPQVVVETFDNIANFLIFEQIHLTDFHYINEDGSLTDNKQKLIDRIEKYLTYDIINPTPASIVKSSKVVCKLYTNGNIVFRKEPWMITMPLINMT